MLKKQAVTQESPQKLSDIYTKCSITSRPKPAHHSSVDFCCPIAAVFSPPLFATFSRTFCPHSWIFKRSEFRSRTSGFTGEAQQFLTFGAQRKWRAFVCFFKCHFCGIKKGHWKFDAIIFWLLMKTRSFSVGLFDLYALIF
jgi:hypothetical protein